MNCFVEKVLIRYCQQYSSAYNNPNENKSHKTHEAKKLMFAQSFYLYSLPHLLLLNSPKDINPSHHAIQKPKKLCNVDQDSAHN